MHNLKVSCLAFSKGFPTQRLQKVFSYVSFFLSFFFFFFLLTPHLRHMEVPRLGVESELQLWAYTTATAVLDPSYICDLPCTLQHHLILKPLVRPRIKLASSQTLYWVLNPLSHNRSSSCFPLIVLLVSFRFFYNCP